MDWNPKEILSADDFRVRLAEALKTLRKNAGYTQWQIAEILRIQRPTYTYYELGKTSPSPYQLYILLSFYQTKFETMLYGELYESAGVKKRIRLK